MPFEVATTAEEAKAALIACSPSIKEMDKASFAAAGRKMKKSLGNKWNDELQNLLKSSMESF